MAIRRWHLLVLITAVLTSLAGCRGNYKFNDGEYRPLGDPEAINRTK